MDLLTILIVLALIATIITLFLGLVSMGGEPATNKEFGVPLMWARVGLQGFAVILLFIAILLR